MTAPLQLADRLRALPVQVQSVSVEIEARAVPSYVWGARPFGLVRLRGAGVVGCGEIVSFTMAAQAETKRQIETQSGLGRGTVASFAAALPASYGRCALEGALIDLAMKQAGLCLAELVGKDRVSARYLVSFEPSSEPVSKMEALALRFPGARFKVDVHPEWTLQTVASMAALDAVEIFDFKDCRDLELAKRLFLHFPEAIFEDPPERWSSMRVAEDRTVLTVDDAVRAAAGGAAVNLKAARMGGFLAVLEALEHVGSRYFGGMFELGIARNQARILAGIFAPEGPNDLAPIPLDPTTVPGPSPLEISLEVPGFGSF